MSGMKRSNETGRNEGSAGKMARSLSALRDERILFEKDARPMSGMWRQGSFLVRRQGGSGDVLLQFVRSGDGGAVTVSFQGVVNV